MIESFFDVTEATTQVTMSADTAAIEKRIFEMAMKLRVRGKKTSGTISANKMMMTLANSAGREDVCLSMKSC